VAGRLRKKGSALSRIEHKLLVAGEIMEGAEFSNIRWWGIRTRGWIVSA
jgi:hypothetical protein